MKKKLLFISSQLPYPPLSGGVIKSFRLLKYFSQCYETTLACPLKFEDSDHLHELQQQLPDMRVIAEDTQIERSPFNWLKSIVNGKTMNEWRSFNTKLLALIREAIAQADIILVDHYEVFQYLPDNVPGKVILHTHNAESQIWGRYAGITSNPIKKWLIKFESKRIEKKEQYYAQKADLVLSAPADIDFIKTGKAAPFIPTYHLGNDQMLQREQLQYDETSNILMYVGTLTWEANVDGLLWFKEQVWPDVKAKNQDIEFIIIGKNPDERLLQWAKTDDQVKVPGFVADLEPFYHKARIFVVPLRFGSGMKVKILDAFYRGLPVATTSIGMESIDALDNEHALIADSPEQFGQKINHLLSHKRDWERLSENSRTLASERYTWQQHLKDLHRAIEQL